MRRPVDDSYPVTGDRASHAAYNVGPATDYGTPIGTPVVAPFAGRLSKYITDTGGLGVILDGADATFHGQHLWVRLTDGDYAEGDRIALTGNTGTKTTGPHLHCYVIVHATGERLAMEEYLTRTASHNAVPFDPTPEPATPKDTTMTLYLLQIDTATDGRWFLIDFQTGTAQRIHNGLQLDLVTGATNVVKVSGPQPATVLDGLTITGE